MIQFHIRTRIQPVEEKPLRTNFVFPSCMAPSLVVKYSLLESRMWRQPIFRRIVSDSLVILFWVKNT
jgi:hypothetical protein